VVTSSIGPIEVEPVSAVAVASPTPVESSSVAAVDTLTGVGPASLDPLPVPSVSWTRRIGSPQPKRALAADKPSRHDHRLDV
jgi:hypothetical protein